jgi:hypothetical protein
VRKNEDEVSLFVLERRMGAFGGGSLLVDGGRGVAGRAILEDDGARFAIDGRPFALEWSRRWLGA